MTKEQSNIKNLADELRWRGPAIALLDLDAFFTSVEQLDHPQWRGKPVVVGGPPEERGVVSTASYEARKFGIHSAQPSAVAKRLCPHAIWTRGHMDRYREMSANVMKIIEAKTPRMQQVSIDEAFFDITPGTYSNESPIHLCQDILDEVAALGITASIGLATNKAIAKMASEVEKPRGFTIVPPGTEHLFIDERSVRELSGIGPAMEKTLNRAGISTLGQLRKASPEKIQMLFGKYGLTMYERINGLTGNAVALPQNERAKSLSHDETFSKDLTNRKDIEEAIKSIGTEVGRRLRKKGLRGREVVLRLKYTINEAHTAQMPLPYATDNEYDFLPFVLQLLDQLWHPGTPVRLVGVGLSRFEDVSEDREGNKNSSFFQAELAPQSSSSLSKSSFSFAQRTFFDEEFDSKLSESPGSDLGPTLRTSNASPASETARKSSVKKDRRPLARTTDSIKDKFGKSAIRYGRDLRFGKKKTTSRDIPRKRPGDSRNMQK